MKTVIGVDFGTLSARAVLADLNGNLIAETDCAYPHGVMDRSLPDGTALGPDWALQHPGDWDLALRETVRGVMLKSGTAKEDVIGIGLDFTSSTWMPVTADGTPLCFLTEHAGNPHAWPKLWKHHAGQAQADRINALAQAEKMPFLARNGGKISPESQLPKTLQTIEEAPEIYRAAAFFVEAGDRMVFTLTGKLCGSASMRGYKGLWSDEDGYPAPEFLKKLSPELEYYARDKLAYPCAAPGEAAGTLTAEAAQRLGLCPGIPVASANIDAHVTMAAAGITRPGQMLGILGTSACFILLGEKERPVEGMSGAVKGGVYPGFYAYEAGQSCMGDHYAWFAGNCCPASYRHEAESRGTDIHSLLTEKAAVLRPGESGLIALDWWNGSRSVLQDADLTGLIIGLTLQTKPEEIYRALIEATAFGARRIFEAFSEAGIGTEELFVSGGISRKNPMAMQIYADVLHLPVRLAGADQGPALGSAIHAAAAAGAFRSLLDAAAGMGRAEETVYHPIPENEAVYDRLYAEFRRLHDRFGTGEDNVMKRLKAIRREQKR